MRFGKKRGLSDVVSTVLIILLVLAAVAIIGAVVLRGIGTSGEKIDISVGCQDLDIKPTKCTVDSAISTASVNVNRGSGGSSASLAGVKLLFENSAGVVTPVNNFTGLPSPLETKSLTYTYNNQITSQFSKVGVAPILLGANGKNQTCAPSYTKIGCTTNDSSLKGWWRLEQGNGTFFVDDTAKLNGTCSGSNCPEFNSSGKFGGAYSFDGNNDIITAPVNTALNPRKNSFTLSAWVKLRMDITSTTYDNGILFHGSNLDTHNYTKLSLRGGANNGIQFMLGGNNPAVALNPTSSQNALLSDGNWHHIVGIRNCDGSGNATIFIDGIVVGSTTSASGGCTVDINSQVHPWKIGATNYGGAGGVTPFNGTIDDVKIFYRALSQAEISAL